jgi:hypothetical protein
MFGHVKFSEFGQKFPAEIFQVFVCHCQRQCARRSTRIRWPVEKLRS